MSAVPSRTVRSRMPGHQDAEIAPQIADLAFDLAYDLDAIFTFVRDHVGYDPYSGLLRGPIGTLTGRYGNSLDQALLLQELLTASLVDARLVTGSLPDEYRVRLEESLIPPDTLSAAYLRNLLRVQEEPSSEADEPVEADFSAAMEDYALAFQNSVRSTADALTADLTTALESAGVTISDFRSGIPDAEINGHVWVRARQGSEWIDLDPSFTDARSGESFAEPSGEDFNVPDELIHAVEFRLIAEQIAENGTTQVELLRHRAPAWELGSATISIAHPQPESFQALGDTIAGVVEGMRNFTPHIQIDSELTRGTPVTFWQPGSVLDAFGNESDRTGDTVAEWLEIEVITPDGSRSERRTVFDRLDSVVRDSGKFDLADLDDVTYVDAGEPNPGYLPMSQWWSIHVATGGSTTQSAFPPPDEGDIPRVFASMARALHFTRDIHLMADERERAVRTFFPGPNVTAAVITPVTPEQTHSVIDMIHRSTGVVRSPASAKDSSALLRAGVLAHAVEHAHGENVRLMPVELQAVAHVSAARVFAEASAGEIPLVVLQSNEDRAQLDIPVRVAAMIDAAIERGQVVVAPARLVSIDGVDRIGWWEIDPRTGEALDRMDDGRGVDLVEIGFLLAKLFACGILFLAVGAAVVYTGVYVANILIPSRDEGSAYEDVAAEALDARARTIANAQRNVVLSGMTGALAGIACGA